MSKSPYASNKYEEGNKNTAWYKILNMIPRDSSVLDVGCSSGNLGEYLKKEGIATFVDGIDIDEGDVKLANKKLDNAWLMDIESGSLAKLRTYDVIIFADVLEHMKDATKVLERMKPHLKKEGKILFSIPNMAHLFVRLQLLAGDFNYAETGLLDKTHLHYYNEAEVRRIFADAGYGIDHFDCTILDYPDELIKEKLNAVGLSANPEFFKIAHDKQATIFEFIGYATISSAKSKSLPLSTTSPLDEVLALMQRIKDADASKLIEAQEKITSTNKHAEKLEAEVFSLRAELEAARRSPFKNAVRRIRSKK